MGQVKPLGEAVLQDMTENLHSPEGSYNLALMAGLTSIWFWGIFSASCSVYLTPGQVKEFTGSNLGGNLADANDPAIMAL